jgi:hypothetical protein
VGRLQNQGHGGKGPAGLPGLCERWIGQIQARRTGRPFTGVLRTPGPLQAAHRTDLLGGPGLKGLPFFHN